MNDMSDTAVQQTASLHEKAVQAVAKGEVTKTRRKRGPNKRPTLTMSHTKVHPEIWAAAKQIVADKRNHYTHIEIRSDQEVIVR